MPFISISESPLAPSAGPIDVYYRDTGSGAPLVFLHGGWGYEIYPFNSQIESFGNRFRIIIPDRSGYGRSGRLEELPADFHRRAAVETLNLLDALEIERPILWGHSDGAVIAALMGLDAPDRISGIVFEAFHHYRVKPASRDFFDGMVANPDELGERVCGILSSEHGEDYWKKLIMMNGLGWRKIADQSREAKEDLYDGRLPELSVPAVFIHGERDPRTEPDELEATSRELPRVPIRVIEEAGHSPHSERASADECSRLADEFFLEILEG